MFNELPLCQKVLFLQFEKCSPQCPDGFQPSFGLSSTNFAGDIQCINTEWDATFTCEPECEASSAVEVHYLDTEGNDLPSLKSQHSCSRTSNDEDGVCGEACSAHAGYQLVERSVCSNRSFSAAVCEPMACETAPVPVANLMASWSPEACRGLPSGGKCSFSCKMGYRAIDTNGGYLDDPGYVCQKGNFTSTAKCLESAVPANETVMLTMSNPQPSRAVFGGTFSRIEVSFSGSVRICPSLGTLVTTTGLCTKNDNTTENCTGICERNSGGSIRCSDIIDDNFNNFLDRLGSNPTCSLSADRTQLIITLGDDPTVLIGEEFRLVDMTFFNGGMPPPSALAGFNIEFAFPALPATELTVAIEPDAPTTMAISIEGPNTIQECGMMRFRASSATGAEGRGLSYRWAIGDGTTAAFRVRLYEYLKQEHGPILLIDMTKWSDILDEAKAAVPSWPTEWITNPVLQITVDIMNWRGLTSEAGVAVTVKLADAPKPTIQYASKKHLTINPLEDATFKVNTGGVLKSTCGNSGGGAQGSTVAAWTVVVQWSITYNNTQDALPPVSTDIANLATEEVILDINNRKLVIEDTGLNPNTLTVPAFHGLGLRYGGFGADDFSSLEISATASYAVLLNGSNTVILDGSTSDPIRFTFEVGDIPPPMVTLTGPNMVGDGCSFDFSAVIDTLNKNDDGSGPPDIHWTIDKGQARLFDSKDADELVLTRRSAGGVYVTQLPFTLFDRALDGAGLYNFTVEGRRYSTIDPFESKYYGWPAGNFQQTQLVNLIESEVPPPITTSAPWNEGDRLSIQKPAGFFVMGRQQSGACKVSSTGWSYFWVVVKVDGGANAIVSTYKVILSNTTSATDDRTYVYQTSEYPGDELEGGARYKYALVYCKHPDAADRVMHHQTLQALLDDDFFKEDSPSFIADSVPSGGTASLQPTTGDGLGTTFSMTAQNWNDERPDLLNFAFYYMMIPETHPLSGSLNCSATSCTSSRTNWRTVGDSEEFKVDFLNETSPDYWKNMQGVRLQAFKSDETISGVRLYEGEFLIFVQAKDWKGGVGIAKVVGPLVSATQNFAMQDARDLVHGAALENNGEALLQIVHALAHGHGSIQSQNGTAAQTSADATNLLMDALGQAEGMSDGSEDSMEAMGDAVATVVDKNIQTIEHSVKLASFLASTVGKIDSSTGASSAAVKSVVSAVSKIVQKSRNFVTRIATGATTSNTTAVQNTTKAGQMQKKLLDLTNQLAKQSMAKTKNGDVTKIDATENGTGIEMSVSMDSSENMKDPNYQCHPEVDGVQMTDCAEVSNKSLGGSRRLRSGDASPDGRRLQTDLLSNEPCLSVGLHQTTWHQSNPLYLHNDSQFFVPAEATVRTVQIVACSDAAEIDLVAPMLISLTVPEGGGDSIECVRFVNGAWTNEGLVIARPYSTTPGSNVKCEVYKVSGAVTYAIAKKIEFEDEPNNALFNMCPSSYLPAPHNITWKCAVENATTRSAFVAPATYALEGSMCIPLCPAGLVINPMTSLAHCLRTGWDMHFVKEMYCGGWWEEEDESSDARRWPLPVLAYAVALLSLVASRQ